MFLSCTHTFYLIGNKDDNHFLSSAINHKHRRSYTSAHVLLIFIKKVEVNEFNKSYNAGAQMLDSVYHIGR